MKEKPAFISKDAIEAFKGPYQTRKAIVMKIPYRGFELSILCEEGHHPNHLEDSSIRVYVAGHRFDYPLPDEHTSDVFKTDTNLDVPATASNLRLAMDWIDEALDIAVKAGTPWRDFAKANPKPEKEVDGSQT